MRFIFAICIAFLATSSVQSADVLSSANCNEWVGQMLYHMRPLVIEKNADPAALPDMDIPFNYTFLFTDHQGWLNLSDGYAIGMSTIRQGGDCFLNYDLGMLLLKLSLLVDEITIDAKHSTHVVGFEPSGNLLASLRQVPIEAHILIDLELSTVALQHFDLTVGDMKITMDGLGILGDALLAVVLAVVDNIFKNQVVATLVDVIRGIVTKALEGIHYLPPIPVTTPTPQIQFLANGLF